MGPRLISRGNARPGRRTLPARNSFNGAAADQSRKWTAKGASESSRRGFNGAAADQSRK